MSSLLSPKMNLPEVKPVKQADTEDSVVLEAKKKKMLEEQARSGRESTNLAASPGPQTYSNTQLGA